MNYRILFCLLIVCLLVGTVSADTYLIYADNDVALGIAASSETWQTLRDNTVSSGAADNGVYPYLIYLTSHASTADRFIRMGRYGVSANTSIVPDTDTVDSAVLRLAYFAKATTLGGTSEAALVLATPPPGNPLDWVLGNYNDLNLTSGYPNELTPRVTWSGITSGNINFTFTEAARSVAINKTGYTTLMVVDGDELDNSFSGTWAASKDRYLRIYGVGNGGATRPYMEIITSTGGATPPVASFTLSKNFIRIPGTVTATDTSTNTPTSWEWSWGDGTANSTTQNPSHQYTKRGKWDIYLTATNAGGSGATGATSIKVAGYENYY
jgi:PKD repeat protein